MPRLRTRTVSTKVTAWFVPCTGLVDWLFLGVSEEPHIPESERQKMATMAHVKRSVHHGDGTQP